METKQDNKPSIKEIVLAEYKKGNIVISNHEGIQAAPLKEIIKQPIDGLLYDLNRNEVVILTFINDPKWINDYALVQVLREFKNQIINLESENKNLRDFLASHEMEVDF
jgi:hypothetical protein